jgi:hypothetical protein
MAQMFSLPTEITAIPIKQRSRREVIHCLSQGHKTDEQHPKRYVYIVPEDGQSDHSTIKSHILLSLSVSKSHLMIIYFYEIIQSNTKRRINKDCDKHMPVAISHDKQSCYVILTAILERERKVPGSEKN